MCWAFSKNSVNRLLIPKKMNLRAIVSISNRLKTITLGTMALSFVGASWFWLTSLSLASASYSFREWLLEKPLSSEEAKHFNSHLQRALHQTFWMTLSVGSFVIFICLVIGGGILVIFILHLSGGHVIEKLEELKELD
jgi:ABC-type spermidine/putrescine transport system permease subunit I